MTEQLTGPIKKAKSGTRKAVVVLMHGYGADGADLIGLADPLEDHLPDVEFRAPNAPERSAMNPMGYQWFPIPQMDGCTEAQRDAGMAASIAMVNAYLDAIEAEGVPADKIALVGFSQGTMMSLHVAPRRARQLACVVGYSGRLLAPERLPAEIRTRPPVLLAHGTADPVVPFASMEEARGGLAAAGIEVTTLACPGVPHSISPDGLIAALRLLKSSLD